MTQTLQQKIDAILLQQWQNKSYIGCNEKINKALQEFREQIKTMPSCTICPYCKQQTLGRNDILTLIGEKQ